MNHVIIYFYFHFPSSNNTMEMTLGQLDILASLKNKQVIKNNANLILSKKKKKHLNT